MAFLPIFASWVTAFGMLLGMSLCRASVEIYASPGDFHISNAYEVDARDQGDWLRSPTYEVSRSSVTSFTRNNGLIPTVNFTAFGSDSPVQIRISRRNGEIKHAAASPASRHIQVFVRHGKAYLTMRPLDKVWLVFDDEEGNPLLIFADPAKPPVPPGAKYYGPGRHEIGPRMPTSDGETIYLDGGAWVIGSIDLRGRSNVTIMGPGVLSGEWTTPEEVARSEHPELSSMLLGSRESTSNGNRIEGVTIVLAPFYNIREGPEYIGNVKLISPWYWSTDGFQAVPRGATRGVLIENCFAFIGDDVFFPRENYLGPIEVRNCFVSATNNSVFQICYWGNVLDHTNWAKLHDIDIKNYIGHDGAIFRASVNRSAETGARNMCFENIRIEGRLICPLIQIENREYFWPDQVPAPSTKLGNTCNMIFRNIDVTMESTPATPNHSTILGLNSNNGHHDYLFDNVTINGDLLSASNYHQYIDVNEFVRGLRFTANPKH